MSYYYGAECGWDQVFTPAVTFASVTWRNDILLPVPQLQFPRPDAVICLDTTPGTGSNILLQWNAVAGATHYLVQWGGNPQLSGPDTREALVVGPTIEYELLTDDDIRLGETAYWRVQAQNRTTGGVSGQSEIRQIKLECNNSKGSRGYDRCTDFDFEAKIKGGDMMSCCDEQVYWLEMTFDCRDQFDRELISVDEVVWEVNSSPDDATPAFIKEAASSDYKVILETCGDSDSPSQVIELKATITFNDFVQLDTFECEVTKKIFVDCDTPFHTRPWSSGGNAPYCYPLCLDYRYQSDEPKGYMHNSGQFLNYGGPYANFVVATGPVFKLPACNGIYTYCCECVPTVLNLFAGDGSTTIQHDSGKGSWYTNTKLPWLGCNDMVGPSEMYCAYDGMNPADWYFLTNVGCGSCIDTSLCPCVPEEFELTIGFSISGAVPSSGSKTVVFTHQGGDLWSGVMNLTPAGCQSLEANIELNFDGPADAELIPGDILNWTSDINGFALSGCDPTSVTFSLTSTNAGCSTDVTLTSSGLSVEQCDPCISPVTLGQSFSPATCDPFYASFVMTHDSLEEDLTVIITDGKYGCDCADDVSGGASMLEARVNIPLSCHFKWESGMLALNLEALIGPGLSINDVADPDCPYIYADVQEGGDCYQYTFIYCCYSVYEIPVTLGQGFGGIYGNYGYDSFNYEFNYEFN